MNYLNSLSEELKKYFNILSPEFPEFLLEYIEAPEMQRIGKISMFCGKDYSKLFGVKFKVSNLDHSVAVALIIWHFTQDKKQTLAGLFHDIATPVFKHCIDFMNGDAITQESTEEKTFEIIKGSSLISSLLNRDGIKLEEVSDYKIYPIADNNTPRLSADRFEYNFTCGLSLTPVWNYEEIKKVYDDVIIGKNEDGLPELAFSHKEIGEFYISKVSKIWHAWVDEPNNVYMQFIADFCKSMNRKGLLSVENLYLLSEEEILRKFTDSNDDYLKKSFNKFANGKVIAVSDYPLPNHYSVKLKVKRRYIIPLVKTDEGFKRIDEISQKAKENIENFLSQKFDKWGCLDFDFKPY